MSNTRIIKVDGQGLERLKVVMSLFDRETAAGYTITDDNRMVFFQYEKYEKMTAFPVPISLDRCAELAFEWVNSKKCDHGLPIDHDGDSEKGWLCYCDGWGRIDGFDYHSFMAVRPFWQHYGK